MRPSPAPLVSVAPGPHRRAVLCGTAALAVAGSRRAQAGEDGEAPSPGVHDLMPEFWRFYDADADGDPQDRAHSLDLHFIGPNAALYRAAGFGHERGPIDDARLAAWLPEFDALAPAARRASQMLPNAWLEHDARFRTNFPAYRSGGPVYLLVSLLAFDLQRETWRGRPCLFVGVDAVVKQAGETPDLAVLLDREDFAAYHAQANPGLRPANAPTPLWVQLWRAGLATYVAAKLNPKAAPADVLMSPELAAVSPEVLRPLAGQALAALETTDPAEDRRFLHPAPTATCRPEAAICSACAWPNTPGARCRWTSWRACPPRRCIASCARS